MRRQRYDLPPIGRMRYVVATLASGGGYVVYDRRRERVADGRYLTHEDAQWAADQRNRGWQNTEQEGA